MWTIILVSLGILLVSFLLLGYISPYSKDNQTIFQIQGEKIIEIPVEKETIKEVIVEVPVEKIVEVEKVIEVEKIVEVPVEKEIIKEIEKIVEVENLDKINQLENEIKQLKSTYTINTSTWRNVGLDLFNTTDLDKFLEILDGLVGKTLLIVTDSSYVLGGDFTDHKVYEGTLDTYEILEGRYPHQPIVKFNITVPILGTTKVNLAWIYDKYKLNLDFSSLELVNDFIKTGTPKNELLLVKD